MDPDAPAGPQGGAPREGTPAEAARRREAPRGPEGTGRRDRGLGQEGGDEHRLAGRGARARYRVRQRLCVYRCDQRLRTGREVGGRVGDPGGHGRGRGEAQPRHFQLGDECLREGAPLGGRLGPLSGHEGPLAGTHRGDVQRDDQRLQGGPVAAGAGAQGRDAQQRHARQRHRLDLPDPHVRAVPPARHGAEGVRADEADRLPARPQDVAHPSPRLPVRRPVEAGRVPAAEDGEHGLPAGRARLRLRPGSLQGRRRGGGAAVAGGFREDEGRPRGDRRRDLRHGHGGL
mmetsp:Transcript_53661/g.153068  ORF Transcript_53661/g.153068 Transcript_53661/m.153068 type:complete len:288 (-) Transcript_53661:575-1438(-)